MTASRAAIKNALEKIAKVQQGTVSETPDEMRLTLPEGEGMAIILTFGTLNKSLPYCETTYTAKGKTFTFNRLGVEDSFYFSSTYELPAQIQEQRTRVKDAQTRLANSREFNLGPVSIFATEERIKQIVDTIKAGKTHTYMPGGFGTGYYFSTNRRITNRFDRATASKELVDLVGQNVYVSQFDAD